MKFKHRQFGFEIKSIDAATPGSFSGYGSIFGNVDSYRDVVMPGAFQKSLTDWQARGKLPPILWQHDSTQPIGPFTMMAEDGKGLYVEGQLLIDDVAQAREAYALLKSGTISGMSIGYNVIDEEYDGKTQVNRLIKVDLWEVSIATFPANTDATVNNVKSILAAGDMPTIKEFEDLLRDAGGYSRKHAKTIAGLGYAKFLAQRDADEEEPDEQKSLDSVVALIERLTTSIT